MPKGPKGEKRPADVIGNAMKVARIATGEEQEDDATCQPSPYASTLSDMGMSRQQAHRAAVG